jgi:hypothetical protein
MDHWPEALQLALAIRARGDVGLGHLSRRQDLQDGGTRQLGSVATVQVWARHIPQNVKCELLDWSKGVAGERSVSQPRTHSLSKTVSKYCFGRLCAPAAH